MPEDWLSAVAAEMTVEMLPREYQAVAEVVGVEDALRLSERLGGLYFYFHKLDSLLKTRRDDSIRREFTGCNHRDLARKYNLTESWIREIVQRKPAAETADLFAETGGKLCPKS